MRNALRTLPCLTAALLQFHRRNAGGRQTELFRTDSVGAFLVGPLNGNGFMVKMDKATREQRPC